MKPPKPMLARLLSDDPIRYPLFAQPKLDGVRCLWDGATAWTRSGRPHAPHVQRLLAGYPVVGAATDGELVIPGMPFDAVNAAVAFGGDNAARLEYHVFDCILPEVPFADRLDAVRSISIQTDRLRDESELDAALERYLDAGHEGIILRTPGGIYEPGYSEGLLKHKRIQDAEFPIHDIVEADGKDRGTALLICRCEGGLFRVQPGGSRHDRARLLADRSRWIGQPYTVVYQGLTRNGLPRFPRGVAARHDVRWVMQIGV